jgi:uncharacterized protein YoaH (UPF0181 family)
MTKVSMLAAAAVAVLAAACAGNQSARTETDAAASSAQSESGAQAGAQSSASSFTDEQLQHYALAKAEIEPLQANLGSQTPEQQQQTTAQISQILQRHGITAEDFNAISRAASQDRTLASRIAAAQPATFSDETLRAFARASIEIDPISRSLANATPEQQAQATEQIRQILARNNIDSATYNAIASRAQADPALAQRIAQLHRADQGAG